MFAARQLRVHLEEMCPADQIPEWQCELCTMHAPDNPPPQEVTQPLMRVKHIRVGHWIAVYGSLASPEGCTEERLDVKHVFACYPLPVDCSLLVESVGQDTVSVIRRAHRNQDDAHSPARKSRRCDGESQSKEGGQQRVGAGGHRSVSSANPARVSDAAADSLCSKRAGGHAVRHAEKARMATCAFADRIAAVSLAAYGSLPAMDETLETVVSAFVLEWPVGVLHVVALGAGTKFDESDAPAHAVADLNAEIQCARVRDGHAEILAQLALKHFFASCTSGTAAACTPMPLVRAAAHERWRLHAEARLHFYTSSAPCGNAVDVTFGTKDLTVDVGVADEDAFAAAHTPMRFPRAAQGEISARHKHDRAHAPLSCSDKIARWNALGVQGGRLSAVLEPVYVSSVTVGRKFSQKRLRRALCCRLHAFRWPRDGGACASSDTLSFRTHHPAILRCAVRLSYNVLAPPPAPVRAGLSADAGAGAEDDANECGDLSVRFDPRCGIVLADGRAERFVLCGPNLALCAKLELRAMVPLDPPHEYSSAKAFVTSGGDGGIWKCEALHFTS